MTPLQEFLEDLRYQFCDDLDDYLVANNKALMAQENDQHHLLTLTGQELINYFDDSKKTIRRFDKLITNSSRKQRKRFIIDACYLTVIELNDEIHYLDYLGLDAVVYSVPHKVYDDFNADIASLLSTWTNDIYTNRITPIITDYFQNHINVKIENIEVNVDYTNRKIIIKAFSKLSKKVNKKAYHKVLPKVFKHKLYVLEELSSNLQCVTLKINF